MSCFASWIKESRTQHLRAPRGKQQYNPSAPFALLTHNAISYWHGFQPVSIPVVVMISQELRPGARPAQKQESHTMLRHYFWHRQESKKSGSQQWALNPPQIPLVYSGFFHFFPSLDKYTTSTRLITKRLASTLVYFTALKLKTRPLVKISLFFSSHSRWLLAFFQTQAGRSSLFLLVWTGSTHQSRLRTLRGCFLQTPVSSSESE